MADSDRDQSGGDDKDRYPKAPLTGKPPANAHPSSGWRPALPPDHPENDLSDDADFSNLKRPAPSSIDELADQEDPLIIAARNRRSSKQALWYLITSLVTTFLFGFVLLVIMRLIAGEETCAAVDGRFLCTTGLQKTWAIIASLPPIGFLIGSMIIMVRKLHGYVRWRPWMGVFWVLVPFTMWVLTITVQVYLSPEFAF